MSTSIRISTGAQAARIGSVIRSLDDWNNFS
jgi:hypothetical protein